MEKHYLHSNGGPLKIYTSRDSSQKTLKKVLSKCYFEFRSLVYADTPKIVSEYDQDNNHKPQTNPWQREVEPLNHHETQGTHTKQTLNIL